MDIRIETKTGSPSAVRRNSIPVERPEGFDDESYVQHAVSAAELVRLFLNGDVDDRHKAKDGATTTMIIADETISDEQLEEAFRREDRRQDEHPSTWSRPHVVNLLPVVVS